MPVRIVAAAEFKATCLKIIDQVKADGQPVTITKRGEPVARLLPVSSPKQSGSIIGALKGSVLRYDDPSAPAVDSESWDAVR